MLPKKLLKLITLAAVKSSLKVVHIFIHFCILQSLSDKSVIRFYFYTFMHEDNRHVEKLRSSFIVCVNLHAGVRDCACETPW